MSGCPVSRCSTSGDSTASCRSCSSARRRSCRRRPASLPRTRCDDSTRTPPRCASSSRRSGSKSATPPRATLERRATTFPRASIVSAYGQTETAGATTLLKGNDATRKLGSVGKPMLGVELRLVDDQGVDVPNDQVGEIVYRGPMLMRGYLGRDEATREAFTGGWFHSGDLARRDDEGYLYIVDRKKDLIVSGGENVYPAEIERVLLDHAAVADAAVVGAPHARWIETPIAFVVLVDGATASERELVDHCRRQLAGYKKLSRVIFVDRLPRNAGGKILRRELRLSHAL